jgi:glutamate-1-semialdehyde 2,1-aminomutase
MKARCHNRGMTLIDRLLADAGRRYAGRRPASRALAERAARSLPGGNTRSVLDIDPFPFRVAEASGAELVDVDGHRYVDLLGNYSAGLLGHDPQPVRDAVVAALEHGWALGATHGSEIELAELLCDRFPSLEQVRFTTSGTEANLMALAAARHVTGRNAVLVFRGGYHGGVLYFGPTGRPLLVPHDWVLADFNDVASLETAFAARGADVACVLVEPMLGASGCIPGDLAFLEALRHQCTESGALLIFDEVMTSRLARGGAQELTGITPDLTTIGKYFAGGMPFGAFGGRRDVMSVFDPATGGGLTHGGTFNNNVVSMAAGVAALSQILTPELLEDVNRRGERLRARLNDTFRADGVPMCVTGWGSLMNIHATAGPVRSLSDLQQADPRLKQLLFLDMLDAGFYLAQRGYIALSAEVTDGHVDAFVTAVADAVAGWPRL